MNDNIREKFNDAVDAISINMLKGAGWLVVSVWFLSKVFDSDFNISILPLIPGAICLGLAIRKFNENAALLGNHARELDSVASDDAQSSVQQNDSNRPHIQ